ncbi:MAG: Oligopeptide transport ATP-binding protein OppD [Firmicutes bacterium ADurb.Bin153]|nr:MAG: Oligopeptide transport ATP-binding protein OppD [Firmicutes bacterium ADurb.Bin153]
MGDLVNIKDLKVSFFTPAGEVQVVREISWELNKGEVVGIVGESGSGKSVSVYALIGLLTPPGRVVSGSIDFDGKDMISLPEKQMQAIRGSDISMVFQDPTTCLNPVYTIGNQLIEAILAHEKLSKKEAHDRAIHLLELVEIPFPERRMKQYPHEFSGGMKQRVMIAMALANNPKLVIADEPTTALDVTIQAQILDLLKNLRAKINMSVILITHDLGIISDVCDRVMVMYAGKIVEKASIFDIFEKPEHPYTKGLLRSIPRLHLDKRERLIPIEGTPVDLLCPPAGCSFAPRCESCMRVCIDNQPPFFDVGEGHQAACWLLHEDFSGRANKPDGIPSGKEVQK